MNGTERLEVEKASTKSKEERKGGGGQRYMAAGLAPARLAAGWEDVYPL